ncbi:hypothetical protein [Candidatus Sororendozoicomonas aggregata]|uniref:hypothetical protein n=1 Tax=Candidatus Sororendozoicomonas aggregata TaxID=3073239 RepID=UPI002ED2F6D7
MKKISIALGLVTTIISYGAFAFTISSMNVKEMSKDELVTEYHQLAGLLDTISEKNESDYQKTDMDICKRFKRVDARLSLGYMTDIDYGKTKKFTSLCNYIAVKID